MSLNSSIISDMEGIVADAFFSETVEHQYPTDETENLTVQWSEPISQGIDGRYESSFPSLIMKSSDAGNLDLDNSRIIRDSKTYEILQIFTEQSGLTKLDLSEVSA